MTIENKNLQDNYILNMLSKIKHKKWELYIITRIIHLLNDDEIEFVCQQHVKTRDNKRFLMDLCFPQLKLYCEIDEGQHKLQQHSINDEIRKEEIIDATDFVEKRIKIYKENDDELKYKKLVKINCEINEFVKFVKKRKKEFINNKTFEPWIFSKKYYPSTYVNKGYLDIEDNPSFLVIKDALKCFGYKGGHLQQGTWQIKGTSIWLWFPKLFKNKEWNNSLSNDLKKIEMEKNDNSKIGPIQNHQKNNLVFARFKTPMGEMIYKFIGQFCISYKESSEYKHVYIRKNTKIYLNENSLKKLDMEN